MVLSGAYDEIKHSVGRNDKDNVVGIVPAYFVFCAGGNAGVKCNLQA